jgi:hypothetical protein
MKMRVVIPDHVLVGFWCCTWGDLPLILQTKRGHPGSTTRSPHIHNNKAVNIKTTRWEGWADTQTGILPASRKCNVRSKFWWFTEFCNSHYVSHFAAFFIVARAKISIAESCITFFWMTSVQQQQKTLARLPKCVLRSVGYKWLGVYVLGLLI